MPEKHDMDIAHPLRNRLRVYPGRGLDSLVTGGGPPLTNRVEVRRRSDEDLTV